jgi:gamma-glutamyl:cysteine ligase YbdK (ATP-grasp superfamily)
MAPVADLSRTIGLEQELFLVDEEGRISHRADELLSLCRVEAREMDLDPENVKGECAKNMVEINAGPKTNLADLAARHLGNVQLAISVGKRLGLRLHPLGTYPLPITPVIRAGLRYQILQRPNREVRTLTSDRGSRNSRAP